VPAIVEQVRDGAGTEPVADVGAEDQPDDRRLGRIRRGCCQASRVVIFQAPMASQPRIQPAMTAAIAQVGMGGSAAG
jgi:hypothetical protein